MKATLLIAVALLVCFASAQNSNSICDRYSKALNTTNRGLVTTVVLGVFGNITAASSPLLTFFNGQVVNYPGGLKVDFTSATEARTAVLADHLVQFFGAALGCTDGTIGAYAGASMPDSHSFMSINNAQFNYFNQAVLGVMRGAGVTEADLTATLTVLETTRTGICNQPDCVASSTASALVPLFLAAVAAVLL